MQPGLRLARLGVVVVFVAGLAVVALPGTAEAATCPGGANKFEGINTYPIITDGTEADITLWNPNHCNASIAWVMITDQSSKWAQTGYGKGDAGGGCPFSLGCYFAQWRHTGSPSTVWGWQIQYPLPYPQTNHFVVYRDSSSTTRMITNGFQWASTRQTWQATRSQWMGEVINPNAGDRLVGSGTWPVAFSGLRHLYQGAWYSDNPNANILNDFAQGEYFSWSTNAFFIWDNRN